MITALYLTIWLSLIGLALGELGRRQQRQTLTAARWALPCSATGLVLAIAHALLALALVFAWDHARAVEVTAARAADMFGVAWAGSLYVNYFFLGWWAIDTAWWWRSPVSFVRRSRAIEWPWRLLVFTMVVNGAVIFASAAGRIAGVPLTALLLWSWRSRTTLRR